jgi:hypothetical protein
LAAAPTGQGASAPREVVVQEAAAQQRPKTLRLSRAVLEALRNQPELKVLGRYAQA